MAKAAPAQQQRKQPVRTCIACRSTDSKRALVRFVRTTQGEVICDPSGKQNGRGAYLCLDEACFAKAKKGRALQRAFSSELSEQDYTRLYSEFISLCSSAKDSRGMVENG